MPPPLADVHVHLLAGLDDGPKTPSDALEMCRIAYDQGIRHSAACAHQNEDWKANSPDRIREATQKLKDGLKEAGLDFQVYPCAEVMVSPETLAQLERGELMTLGDSNKYLLIEMPHGMCVEVGWMVEQLSDRGLTPIIGHPERCPELLEEPGAIEKLIAAGCLVQVSSKSITDPKSSADEAAVKDWFQRGCVHFLGSDGHSIRRRPPMMAEAYEIVKGWVGPSAAEKIGSLNGISALNGRPVFVQPPLPPKKKSWLKFW